MCIIKVLRRAFSKELYVVSIVAYQDYQDQDYQDQWMDVWQKKKLYFHTRGTEWRMRTIIIVQEVKVHGWLLSELKSCTLLLFSDSCS